MGNADTAQIVRKSKSAGFSLVVFVEHFSKVRAANVVYIEHSAFSPEGTVPAYYLEGCIKYPHGIPSYVMKFSDYYRQLSSEEREQFAERAKTSTKYIEIHLLTVRKVARKDMMKALAAASQGHCSEQEILQHFYSDFELDPAAA